MSEKKKNKPSTVKIQSSNQDEGFVYISKIVAERNAIAEQRSIQELQTLIDHLPDSITRFNEDLQFIFVNKSFLKNVGKEEKEVIGKTNYEIGTPKKIADQWTDLLRNVFKTGKPGEMETYYPHEDDMRYMMTRVVPEFDENGNISTLLTIGRDLTEKKIAAEQYKQQSHNLQRIQDTVPYMISVIDLQTRKFEYLNRETFKAYDFNAEIMDQKTPQETTEIVHPDDRQIVAEYFQKLSIASEDELISVEYRAKDDNGAWKWFLVKGKTFQRNQHGEVTHVLNVISDISERKKTQEQLIQLNISLSEVNEEIKKANNELKNLHAITAVNFSEALRHVYIYLETIVTTDARNLSNSSRTNIRRAQAAIQKMKLLTNDIHHYLELYDVGIKKELIDPNTILIDVKEKMQKKIEDANAKINIDQLPNIFADPTLFLKLMIAIIDNSIKFRKQDADPVININYSLVGEINSNSEAKENTAYIITTITDNGIGFNNEDADKIFGLFTQLDENKHRGSGIGLAICKKIMEMHGGFITAESKPGEGSVFSCYFSPAL